MNKATWIEISAGAISHNLQQLRNLVGANVLIAPVVKGNAYGHGLEVISKLCEKNRHANWMCTANLSEALELRLNGITKPILVLAYIDVNPALAIAHDIKLTVYDLEIAKQLSKLACKLEKVATVHIKVDTGLSRVGILPGRIKRFVEALTKLPGIFVEGLFTHFADVNSADISFTAKQKDRFQIICNDLKKSGFHIPLKHVANSAATTAYPRSHYDLVRSGICTYGVWRNEEIRQISLESFPSLSLKPALTWKTKVVAVKALPKNSFVGYGKTYVTESVSKTAIVPVGYADGYPIELSNKGCVVINNKKAKILGTVCMNMMIVDVTAIPNVHIGSEVLLIGEHPGTSTVDMQKISGTYCGAIITRLNPLIDRIIVE